MSLPAARAVLQDPLVGDSLVGFGLGLGAWRLLLDARHWIAWVEKVVEVGIVFGTVWRIFVWEEFGGCASLRVFIDASIIV